MIFIDADAFIGINAVFDVHHRRALSLFTKLEANHDQLVTSWDVIDEVTTKLSYTTTKDIAERFLRDILFLGNIQIEYSTPFLSSTIEALYRKQTSKHVSLTDCANMVIAKNLGITTFFSFDHHYEQNGFRLLK